MRVARHRIVNVLPDRGQQLAADRSDREPPERTDPDGHPGSAARAPTGRGPNGPGGPGADRQRGSDYADLSRQVRAAGLLERRRGYYAVRIGLVVASFAGLWAVFFQLGESWWQLAVAAALAVVFAQAGFVGHDAGHRQIARSRRVNDLIGIVHGNLLTGISIGWWVDKHNRHHAHPNTEGRDPDITVEPLSFTTAQARRRRGLGALVVRHQAYLFFPLLLLEGLSLHVNSVRAVLSPSRIAHRPAEAGLLVLHLGGYLAAVFLVLSPAQAVAFVLVNQGLFGLYLGCSFAPNHKGMPVLRAGDDLDYLRRQVLTSRNVRGGVLVDAGLGGLNYQIEHHLFPSMPCTNLRRVRPLVRRFCAEHGIAYHETTLGRSWAETLRHLHQVGRSSGPASGPDGGDGAGTAAGATAQGRRRPTRRVGRPAHSGRPQVLGAGAGRRDVRPPR